MFFDGAVNIKGVGIGAILISPTGQHHPATTRLWFFCTNNAAEYEARIMGMNMTVDLDVQELLIMDDSDLIIQQLQGEWETRDIKLIPYRQHVEDISKQFKSVEFKYIPRFHNELADALATLASMLLYPGNVHIDQLKIQARERHGYCNAIEMEPDDSREDERIMNEVHSGVCGPYTNEYVLAKKILRAELHPMSVPWSFVAWDMDVIRPIEPKASNGHIFILVTIDYFTK
ncbi:uncharacterized protein [Nicotiana tomentosiformis]|uniref:uncharacterized protein n=1 Tax=Nicotiana tomentosiformis TaxID=4098 RepID=UPI00051B0229